MIPNWVAFSGGILAGATLASMLWVWVWHHHEATRREREAERRLNRFYSGD